MTIQVERLSRSFGTLQAVKGIDFEVGKGETFGFLGPNGAGKSTTIKMLCTLLRPSSGRAIVNGYDVERESGLVRQSIGIVFQDNEGPQCALDLVANRKILQKWQIWGSANDTFPQRNKTRDADSDARKTRGTVLLPQKRNAAHHVS